MPNKKDCGGVRGAQFPSYSQTNVTSNCGICLRVRKRGAKMCWLTDTLAIVFADIRETEAQKRLYNDDLVRFEREIMLEYRQEVERLSRDKCHG